MNPFRTSRLSDHGRTKSPWPYQDPNKLKGAASHQILWTTSNAAPSQSGYLVTSTRDSASTPGTQNYLADHQASIQLVSDPKAEFNPHSQMREVALNETVVLPNQQISGSSWFQRDGKLQDMILRVPVGGIVYEFPFSFNQGKVALRCPRPVPALQNAPRRFGERGIFLPDFSPQRVPPRV